MQHKEAVTASFFALQNALPDLFFCKNLYESHSLLPLFSSSVVYLSRL
ncbi:hypothetical protein ENTCAN_08320 [Enterobacter cancerogenus ATCC 35316]|nr:hypothetical protein ENTCAN_08320 [Enterobacter cancerogenus ATCC 35316]